MLADRHGGDAVDKRLTGNPVEDTRRLLGVQPKGLGANVIGGLLREALVGFSQWLETLDGAYVDSKTNDELIDEFLALQGIPE